jgi:transcriptional regulator with XRE-family HTH domain
MLFARNLETVRHDHQMTIPQYAEILGLSESTIRRAASRTKGKDDYNPSLRTLIKTSKAFGVSIDTLISRRVENL